MAESIEHRKTREVSFDALHPDPNQAQSALWWLAGVPGFLHGTVLGPQRLLLHYDVQHLTLTMIETALSELGFHLDNSLLCKLRRALYAYCEENERAHLGLTTTTKDFTRAVFIEHYQHKPHGCRDERPAHWREYR